MTDTEKLLNERAATLYAVAVAETDPTLKAALFAQHQRIAHRAIALQLARKQNTLMALGVPVHA